MSLLAGGAVALALVLTTTLTRTAPTYDEPWYLATVELLRVHGLGVDFVRALPGPAGPLYTVVQAAFSPLTHLQVPGVRLVNCLLLGVVLVATTLSLRSLGSARPWTASTGLLGIPMLITTAGMALTEMPAVALAAVSVALLLASIDGSPQVKYAGAALAGLAMGLAALGRQPMVLVSACAPLLLIGRRERGGAVSVFILFAAGPPAWLFATWGGLVPNAVAFTNGFSVGHGLLSCSYGLAVLLLGSPRLVLIPWRWAVVAVGGGVVLNVVGAFYEFIPLRTVLVRVLGEEHLGFIGRLAGGVFLGAGCVFLLAMAHLVWRVRTDGRMVFLVASAAALVLANVKVAHIFSSRYVVPATPFLALLDPEQDEAGIGRPARLLVGAAIGFLSLHSYLSS